MSAEKTLVFEGFGRAEITAYGDGSIYVLAKDYEFSEAQAYGGTWKDLVRLRDWVNSLPAAWFEVEGPSGA